MKRIVMMAIVLLMVPNISGGHRGFRYSPYAFSYQHPSGLVPVDVYYSPYAFSYQYPSGLVVGHSGYPYPYYFYPYYLSPYDCPPPIIFQRQLSNVVSIPQTKEKREAEIKANRQKAEHLKKFREKDGKEIIADYLRENNIAFNTNNGFYAKDKTVSVDFFIKDKNLIIKYQNPEEIQIWGQKWKQWEDFCAKSRLGEWKIYEIKSFNKGEIVANLALILILN